MQARAVNSVPRHTHRGPWGLVGRGSLPDRPPGSVAVVLGTRPEIIKLAGVVRHLGPSASIIFTGQHYDDSLAAAFFRSFGIAPSMTLDVGGRHRGVQIGAAVSDITHHFLDSPVSAVLVQGDTNAALAGALAANASETPLLHVEAGLRSFDRAMPEEHNRVLIDHLADRCCAPTATSATNLLQESIARDRIAITGNTVVEAVHELVPPPHVRRSVLAKQDLEAEGYVLATFHRQENTDERDRLETILGDLHQLPLPVVLPLHPRTGARIDGWNLRAMLEGLRIVPPLPYPEFLALAADAAVVVSDSGGIQEEASVLKRPVAVVRNSTERPEVLGTFCRLSPPGALLEVVTPWLDDPAKTHRQLQQLPSPYGDGSASERCVAELSQIAPELVDVISSQLPANGALSRVPPLTHVAGWKEMP